MGSDCILIIAYLFTFKQNHNSPQRSDTVSCEGSTSEHCSNHIVIETPPRMSSTVFVAPRSDKGTRYTL